MAERAKEDGELIDVVLAGCRGHTHASASEFKVVLLTRRDRSKKALEIPQPS